MDAARPVGKSLWSPDEVLGLNNIFIGISGLIGAGKTTLCTALAKVLGLPAYVCGGYFFLLTLQYEPVIDNAYLEDFYRDQKKYSFTLQVYLLNMRFKQQQQIIWNGVGGVQDRTIYEDSVFGIPFAFPTDAMVAKVLYRQGLMEKRDYETYCSLFANMSNFMRKPNLIVHLDVTPEESLERIKRRNRSCEANIPLQYLKDLHQAYEEYISDISKVIPVIKVNWSEFRTAEEMADVIRNEYAKLQMIRSINFESKQGSVQEDS